MSNIDNIQFIANINGYEIVRIADSDDPMSGSIEVVEGCHAHRSWRFVDNSLPKQFRGDHPTELTAIGYARNVASQMPKVQ